MTAGQADTSYEALFEAHPQALWVFDRESLRFLAVNQAAVAAYGYERSAFLEMKIADIRPAEDGSALETGVSRHRKQDGSLIDVRVRSNPISFAGRDACLVLVEDVTAESRLEEQLRQSQKMEAIGNLAGGI
ncbi:MAG: two-component system, cell cycle sensor histidine kinase and response regulator CckA, partial [Gaiellaceae bacterium]|nr:two-component system, cell cycle sensor histidine kinase and response regulator CckA [Gaiellaceae bacterium]